MLYTISVQISFDLHALNEHSAIVGDDALHASARRYAREMCDLLEGELIDKSLVSQVAIPFQVAPSKPNLL